MRITDSQRKQLEALGYTVNKSGTSVQNKSGGTVGGYNANGQVFGGSAKVAAILKAKAETKPATKAETKPTTRAKPKPSASKSSAPSAAKDAKPIYDGKRITRTELKTSLPKAKELTDAEIMKARKAYADRVSNAPSVRSRPTNPTPPTAYASRAANAVNRTAPTAESRAASYEANKKTMGARMGNYTKAQWDAMSLRERQAKGLPLRPIDAWTVDGDWKPDGYAKGGLVKKKGK